MTVFSGEIHPAAALFPMMADTELEQLAADIKTNGLRQPIVLDGDGRLVDGRNRLRACEIADVKPAFVSVNGDDPVGLVVSLNVKRRNLTQSQRAVAAGEAAEYSAASNRRIADMFGVDEKYIRMARALVERDPDAAAAVKAGSAALADAHEALKQREQETKGRQAAVDKLRADHPDLAELVDAGSLTLGDAIASATERDRAERERRRVATANLKDAIGLLDHGPDAASHAVHTASLLTEQPDPHALDQAIAFLTEIRTAIGEGK